MHPRLCSRRCHRGAAVARGVACGHGPFHRTAEVAAAAGLIVGLFWQPLAIAAATGFALTVIGAVSYHVYADDYASPETWGGERHGPLHSHPVPLSAATAATLTLAT
ncbi:DoxX family protein [Streptomyces scopuliridis]|uniref:DoxX family protein n=1 Tax=Streptomyces scopuliridis TaxID=452529 RepID=UPI00367F5739